MDRIPTLTRYITETILRQPGRPLAPDQPLISSGLIDSFHLVDLALFVEDTFGVRLDDAELTANHFDTLAELDALLAARS